MSKALEIVDKLLDEGEGGTRLIVKDIPPAQWSMGDDEKDVEQAARSAYTAHSHALTTGKHHPKLWSRIKGSPFEADYVRRFKPTG